MEEMQLLGYSCVYTYVPVRSGARAALVHGATDWFSQVTREGGVRKQEAGVRAGPVEVRVVQLLL